MTTTDQLTATVNQLISPDTLLDHWQGHRRLTRKMIEAFPEDKLFTYSIGGMRPFAELVYGIPGNGRTGLKRYCHRKMATPWVSPIRKRKS